MIWKTGDGEQGRVNKTLMYAELVRAVGRNDADASGTNLHFIVTAVVSCDGERVGFFYRIKRNALYQLSVLINLCGYFYGIGVRLPNPKQTARCEHCQQKDQQ